MCLRYCLTLERKADENYDTLHESSRLAGGQSNFQDGGLSCQTVVAKSNGLSPPLVMIMRLFHSSFINTTHPLKMQHDVKLPVFQLLVYW